jgi:hypothetical protein
VVGACVVGPGGGVGGWVLPPGEPVGWTVELFSCANACSEYRFPLTTLFWSQDTSHNIIPPIPGKSRTFCKEKFKTKSLLLQI